MGTYAILSALTVLATKLVFIESQSVEIATNETILAVKGENLTIWCRALRGTFDRLEWRNAANGDRIGEHETARITSSRSRTYYYDYIELQFTQIMDMDSSTYACCGVLHSNGYCKRVDVNVTDGHPPSFRLEFVSYDFVEGDDVTLTCQASGQPTPTYRWLDHNGLSMHYNEGNWNVSSTEGWLKIYSINMTQAGTYTCVASNLYGNASKLYLVNVSRGRPPTFRSTFETYTTAVGNNVTLKCYAEGHPTPQYTWFDVNGTNMHNASGNWDASTRGTLTIYSIEQSQEGNYTCFASNIHGYARKLYQINLQDYPDEGIKMKVSIREVWQTLVRFTIALEYTKARYSYISTRFQRESSDNDTWTGWSVVTWNIGEDYMLTGLKPGTRYSFQFGVSERYRDKPTWLDRPLIALTLPPFSPQLIVNKLKEGLMQVEFPYQSFDELNGSLKPLYFVLRYVKLLQKSGTFYENDCPLTIKIPPCYGRRYTIADLSSGSYYKIQLLSMLQDGPSHKSETIVRAM